VHAGVRRLRLRLRIRGKLGKSRGSAIGHFSGLWLAATEIIFIPQSRLVQRVSRPPCYPATPLPGHPSRMHHHYLEGGFLNNHS
jgi:hypothetical protein